MWHVGHRTLWWQRSQAGSLGEGYTPKVELFLVLKGGWDTLREDSRAVRRGGEPGAKPPSLLPGRESLWDTLLCQQPWWASWASPKPTLDKLNCSFSVFTSKAHNYEKLSVQNTVIAITLDPWKELLFFILSLLDCFLYFRHVRIYDVLTSLTQIASMKSINW